MCKKNLFKTMAIVSIIFASIYVVGKTFSIFTSKDSIVNKFTTADVTGEVVENFPENEKDWEDPVIKEVKFKNTGTTDAVIRVNFLENWKQYDEEEKYLSNIIDGEEVTNKIWTAEWSTEWTKGNDGWYYYNYILKPEESTKKVLEAVEFKEKFKEEYKDADYNLTFNMECVNADTEATKEVFGVESNYLGDGQVEWTINQ
ncbi:MAG: hypothetical protein HUJ77_07740 [Clostridium sp.]|uniref:BsaA family SipW-dependent biofilm matrix protein n=1 Tax=Clostridium sp. TaxID=1506 RepID=UPI0025C0D32D|nr:BsaA family SipW-dependent biofilm matrix protein [Clostridium sp.]MCF0148275.1 hypothetical protein [Clostridium sp.]